MSYPGVGLPSGSRKVVVPTYGSSFYQSEDESQRPISLTEGPHYHWQWQVHKLASKLDVEPRRMNIHPTSNVPSTSLRLVTFKIKIPPWHFASKQSRRLANEQCVDGFAIRIPCHSANCTLPYQCRRIAQASEFSTWIQAYFLDLHH